VGSKNVSQIDVNEVVVLKLSGSLFFSKEFDRVVSVLQTTVRDKSGLKIAVVTGGGTRAREYIEVAKRFGADQATMDEIGISVSRLNALVLASALGRISVSYVPKTLREVSESLESHQVKRVVVLGGLHPGQSTNAVGALVAEKLRAHRFINATDVDGVFTKDPRKFPNAKRLDRVTSKELSRILGSESMMAGAYDLMDPVALKLIERSKIKTWIIRCEAKHIKDALMGSKIEGTEIVVN
jgi:uridylate kinase